MIEKLPTFSRFTFGVFLILTAAAYFFKFTGASELPDPNAEIPLPNFVGPLFLSGAIMIVAAVMSEFIAKNKYGLVLSYLASGLGVILTFALLLPPVLTAVETLPPVFRFDKIQSTLPWVLTFSAVFLGMLPRSVSQEENGDT